MSLHRRLERLEGQRSPSRVTGRVDIWEQQPDGNLHCARTGETMSRAALNARPDMQIIVSFNETRLPA